MKKKLFAITCAALICASFAGCGSSTESTSSAGNSAADSSAAGNLSAKTDALKAAVETPEMVVLTKDTVKDILGVDSADVTDFSALNCGNGAYPDAFGIFTAKDADAAKRVEDALKKFVEKRNKDFKDYKPNEMYKLDDSFVETNGTTVVFAICADNSKAKELLK